ncbi:MAG: glycosyltransferase family 4 protein [Patescibacteria group bacterium]
MNIGLITQAYYPVLGGVTEHVWHLGKELERRGHKVTVVTGSARRADDRGLRVLRHGFQIPLMSNGANIHVTWGWKLGRLLQRIEVAEKFDLVHVQSPLDPGLPLIASKAMRTPKVGTYHTFREPATKTALDYIPVLFKSVFLDAIAKIQVHLAVSPAAAASLHRYFPQVKMSVIPNGIDTALFAPTVQPWPQYRDGKMNVLFVGRMDPRKGAKYLFGALPYLEEKLDGKYRIVVVGTGWMQKYYDAYIPPALRRRVEFKGYAAPSDLPRYYRSADVYCSPATGNESFGIVLLEAMASGVPVVASDIDGYRGVIESGQEGLLVPPRSSKHLAEAIVTLANDPARRRAMGEAGRRKALRYSWPKIVDQLLPIYEQVRNKE